MNIATEQIAYTRRQAAEQSGYSQKIIDAAVRAGDLVETYPEINGRRLKRGRILHADLQRWLEEGRS